MKKAVLFVLLAGAFRTSGQEAFFDFKKHIEKKQIIRKNIKAENKLVEKLMNHLPPLYQMQPQADYLFSLSNGTKVYSLPQDKMPCLVPDMSEYNMPNIIRKNGVTGMPPGSAPPNKIIPDNNRR